MQYKQRKFALGLLIRYWYWTGHCLFVTNRYGLNVLIIAMILIRKYNSMIPVHKLLLIASTSSIIIRSTIVAPFFNSNFLSPWRSKIAASEVDKRLTSETAINKGDESIRAKEQNIQMERSQIKAWRVNKPLQASSSSVNYTMRRVKNGTGRRDGPQIKTVKSFDKNEKIKENSVGSRRTPLMASCNNFRFQWTRFSFSYHRTN